MTGAPSGPFAHPASSDWAVAWIDYLFRGLPLPDSMAAYGATLAPVAAGLRGVLGVYSFGMLIIAVLVLFYHLAAMVAETAHQGVVFGRRVNQLWAPIRLVFALALLVPVSSSLSSGQYLVIKLAQEGSALASNAWEAAAASMKDTFSTLVVPRGPNFPRLAAAAVEMEICRLVYRQLYDQNANDTLIHAAGDINNLVKMPADPFAEEIWRYSNILNADAPLCGEYRFSGYRRHGFAEEAPTDEIARVAATLSSFSHAETDNLVIEAQAIAGRAAPVFLDVTMPVGADIHNDLDTLQANYRDKLGRAVRTAAFISPQLVTNVVEDSVPAGWIAAGVFIPEVVRLQEGYGELLTHGMPDAQEPVLDHPAIAQELLTEAVRMPPFLYMQSMNTAKLAEFYGQLSRVMGNVHKLIFTSQLSEGSFVPISAFDIRDRLNAGTGPEAAFALFAKALDAAAVAGGVWGGTGTADAGYPFAAPVPDMPYNPFASLTEFGHRQYDLAVWLFGMAAEAGAAPHGQAPSLLTDGTAAALLAGGLALIFLVPFLPFFRFALAALAWILNLFEAVAAMPLVALGHMTPSGEGLSGSMARQSYMLWIALMIRPVLALAGLIAGLVFFMFGMAFLGIVLGPFARLAAPENSGLLIVANMGLVLLYDVLAYAVANVAFKGIYLLPEGALRWISSFVVTDTSVVTVSSPSSGPMPGSGLVQHFLSHIHSSSSASASASVTRADAATAASRNQGMKQMLFPVHKDAQKLDEERRTVDRRKQEPGGDPARGGNAPLSGNPQPLPKDPRKPEDRRKPEAGDGSPPRDKNPPQS